MVHVLIIQTEIKKKNTTINTKKTNDRIFQYAATVALNYGEIKWKPGRVWNIKPFINKFNWTGINYPSKIDDWKTLEKNNISRLNLNYENQVILLTISNEEKKGWHYLVVKKLSTLLRGISSKHHSCFYCLNCLHCFRIGNKRKSHEKVCKNKVFCRNVIASEKILY